MALKACKKCKRLVKGSKCPVCKDTKLIDNWKGKVIIINPENSMIAKKLDISEAGEYAIRL